MGSVCRNSDSGSRGTKCVEFIQCIDGDKPQIHKIWCPSSDGITRGVHLTAQIYVGAATVGPFTTNFLSENECNIPVIRQIYINGSVKILDISADAWGCRLPFIENVQAPNDHTYWGNGGTSNNK